ncbi:hypothetical protein [Pseudochelatococcus contaminans]|uniref:Uncharacterized protein n=1 Tax=Pseudochelatococcus contaminans TaxID=1538103 RepID=A0A7W6EGH8_9HYPH|nr:hypothetical protein [Pseudochelatococcus contaminans]MBB3809451.1 hypothetical protein [Pseudochelatococcus contaminans]
MIMRDVSPPDESGADAPARYEQWSLLLDRLCVEKGHADNRSLASTYCAAAKKETAGDYASALKNLENWRSGSHAPSRRNFRILTQILGIQERDEAWDDWNALYQKTQRRKPATEAEMLQLPEEPLPETFPRWRGTGLLAAGLAVTIAAALIAPAVHHYLSQPDSSQLASMPDAVDVDGTLFYMRSTVRVAVGESLIVHGNRGDCGEQPPSWQDTLANLPPMTIGRWSDGGVGKRGSNTCGGPTPARAVVFTGTQPGEDKIMLYGDLVFIRVDSQKVDQ